MACPCACYASCAVFSPLVSQLHAKDEKTIDLAIIPWPGWVPALADHAGKFWEAEGLAVNVLVYDNDALILEDFV